MSANVHRLPLRPAHTPQTLFTAYVHGRTPQGFLLDDSGLQCARAAVSCLLEPQTGDTVLVVQGPPSAQGFILAVLDRPDSSRGTLILPGNNHVVLTPEHMQMQAQTLTLHAAEKIEITSSAVNLTAATSTVNVKHWQGWFDTVDAGAVNISLVAKTLSSRLGRLIQRATESFRKTEGLDEVRAGRSHVHIEGHQHTQADHITSVAKGFVKIDGQKIDLG